MKEEISQLMDGELDDDQSLRLCSSMQNPEARHEWQVYHLMGDTLRGTPSVSADFMQRFSDRLSEEPTVLAPQRAIKHKPRMVALSAAASLSAVGLVVWAVLQTGAANPPASTAMAKAPQTTMSSNDVNPYLLAHQEYSPSVAMQGMAPYIRTVSVQEVAAR